MPRTKLVEDFQGSRMCSRRARREVGPRELLTREGRREHGEVLRRRGAFPGKHRRRHGTLLHREHRRSRVPVEEPDVPGLGDLRHGIHGLAPARHGDEHRRGREVAIPEVVPEHLIMPDALAGARVECDDAVREQVVANAIRAVEVEGRRARGGKNHRALRVDRHARPRIGATRNLPRLGGPGIVSEFTRMRDRVETPAQRAGLDVVRPDVAGSAGERLGNGAPDDQQILEHDARRARAHREAQYGAPQPCAQIDPAAVPERTNRLPRRAVECVQPIAIVEDHPVARDDHPPMANARGGRRAVVRIEAPELLSRCSVQGEHLEFWRGGIQHAVHDDRIGLHFRTGELIVRLVGPRNLQLLHVGGRDLAECRVVRVVVAAAIHGPIDRAGLRRLGNRGTGGGEQDRGGNGEMGGHVGTGRRKTHRRWAYLPAKPRTRSFQNAVAS